MAMGTPPDTLSKRDRELANSANSDQDRSQFSASSRTSPAEAAKADPLGTGSSAAAPVELATDKSLLVEQTALDRLRIGRAEREAAEKARAEELAALREQGIDPLEA